MTSCLACLSVPPPAVFPSPPRLRTRHTKWGDLFSSLGVCVRARLCLYCESLRLLHLPLRCPETGPQGRGLGFGGSARFNPIDWSHPGIFNQSACGDLKLRGDCSLYRPTSHPHTPSRGRELAMGQPRRDHPNIPASPEAEKEIDLFSWRRY